MFQDIQNIKFNNKGKILIQDDAVVFTHIIDYLKNGEKKTPELISYDLKIKIENEISYWNLYHDICLKDYRHLTLP